MFALLCAIFGHRYSDKVRPVGGIHPNDDIETYVLYYAHKCARCGRMEPAAPADAEMKAWTRLEGFSEINHRSIKGEKE